MVQCRLPVTQHCSKKTYSLEKEKVVEIYYTSRKMVQSYACQEWFHHNCWSDSPGLIRRSIKWYCSLYDLIYSECIKCMCELSIMSQFETKHACLMRAAEFPESDRISLGNIIPVTISLGNIIAVTILPSDRIFCAQVLNMCSFHNAA